MFKMAILLLALTCLFCGCAISEKSPKAGRRAFWGRKIEPDGTEHLRMGDLLIKTQGGKSR